MLGFKTIRCARILIAGIEVMHMIRKGQLGVLAGVSAAPQGLRNQLTTHFVKGRN